MISKKLLLWIIGLAAFVASVVMIINVLSAKRLDIRVSEYSGSESCRPCHENFYQLWSPSHHGLAMQPVTAQFIKEYIAGGSEDIKVGKGYFNVRAEGDSLLFTWRPGSGEPASYKAIHVMGGKYVYYFLAELDRGRLQVLPLAYDVHEKNWYNNPESGVRHFEDTEDSPLDWTSHLYTFNTSCYSCHVSQLENNYDQETMTYNTTWREPGINCETCHGPSADHIRACVKAGEGNVPEDLKIIQTSIFTARQHDSSCGSCHSKSAIVATGFNPGDEFYDYFNLTTLENLDFYPDGRDLGENYTMTGWEMNACRESGELHCVTCHTSSGRYRFASGDRNLSCAPCHNDKVNDPASHTFHKADSEGSICISCHMPLTTFARMDRSDHSFRPPSPRATIMFGSPNACNICHTDRSPEWADRVIGETHSREYQDKITGPAMLVDAARKGDWTYLPGMIEGLKNNSFDIVTTTSLVRLLENYPGDEKWNVLAGLAGHASPLVRSAVAHSLSGWGTGRSMDVLKSLAVDPVRLVRSEAGYSLSSLLPLDVLAETDSSLYRAVDEYRISLLARPDDWSAHYNLGNFYSREGLYNEALSAYLNAVRIYPEAVIAMVNAGYIYSVIGNMNAAENMFQRALSYQDDSEAALLNLALLYGESGRSVDAEIYYERLLEINPVNGVALYNLSLLVMSNQTDRSLQLIRKAAESDPGNPRYSYTLAWMLNNAGKNIEAVSVLSELTEANPGYADAWMLLAEIKRGSGDLTDAREILRRALGVEEMEPADRERLAGLLVSIN